MHNILTKQFKHFQLPLARGKEASCHFFVKIYIYILKNKKKLDVES